MKLELAKFIVESWSNNLEVNNLPPVIIENYETGDSSNPHTIAIKTDQPLFNLMENVAIEALMTEGTEDYEVLRGLRFLKTNSQQGSNIKYIY